MLLRQLDDPIPSVRIARAELPDAIDDVLAAATSKQPGDRTPTAASFALALRAAASAAPGTASMTHPVRARSNPYKGLRAFGEADAADFHGRDRLVDELVDRLAGPEERMLAVVGPSGSGKSSVVRAGLLPALAGGRVAGSASWFSTTMVPGARPFEALETALLRIAVNPPAALLDQLRDGDRGILRAVKRILPDDDGVVAIVIDQFEELFTAGGHDPARDQFLRSLAVAATEAGSPVRILLTLRADFYDRPLRHPEFAPLLKQHTVVVTPLAPDELEHAIVTPAAAVGVGFEPGLVAEIVADVNHEPGALPLLQYALTQVFDATDGDTITIDSYRAIGGLTGALGRQAAELYRSADADERSAARRGFGRLVALGEGAEDTRRRVRRSELGDDPATTGFLDRFGRARLLTFDRDPATREPTVEVAHEALIREWPRLRSWLDDDRDGLRIHRHLTETAATWIASDRDDGELYRGGRLEAASTWAAGHDRDLNGDERQFLAASIAAHEADLAVERQRFEDQVRANRRLRALVATAVVIALVAAAAGIFALQQRSRAAEQADEALAQAAAAEGSRLDAEAARGDADRNAAEAVTERGRAEQNAREAEQQAAAARAAEEQADLERIRAVALSTAAQNPSVAALLAVEAHRLDPSVESLDALHRVLTEIPGYDGLAAGGPYLDAALLSDATMVAASESSLDVWDLEGRATTNTIDHASPGGLADIAPIGDGRIAALDDGRVSTTVYDISTGEVTATVEHGSVVNDISVARDGARLAAAMANGEVGIWSIDSGTVITSFDTGTADVSFVRWHPEADQLAVVTSAAGVQLWDVAAGQPIWVNPEVEFDIVNQVNPFAASFSPSGERFAYIAGSVGGGLFTLDTSDGSTAFDRMGIPGLDGFPIDDLAWTGEQSVIVPGRLSTVSLDLTTGVAQAIVGQYVIQGRSVLYSPSVDRWVVAGTAGLEFWSDDGSGPLARAIALPSDQFASLARNGGPMLASLADDGSKLVTSVFEVPVPPPVYLIDLTTARPTPTEVPGLGIVIGYGEFTLAGTDFQISMLDRDLRPIGTPVPLPPDFSELGVSDDGRFFAFGRLGGKADVYRSSGDFLGTVELGTPDEFGGAQNAPWFTSDGRYMTLSTTDGRSGLWRTEPLERIEVPERYRSRWSIALGPWLFAQGGDDGTTQRLDPDTLDEVGDPIPLYGRSALGYPKYDATRNRIAVSGPSGVTVIDVGTGLQLGRDLPYAGGSNRIEFSGDGSILSVPRFDGTIALWNFDTDTWADVACAYAGRNLTADEWAQVGPRTIDYRATCPHYPIAR